MEKKTKRTIILFIILVLFLVMARPASAQTNACTFPPATQSSLSQYALKKGVNVGGMDNECLEHPADATICKQTVIDNFKKQFMVYEADWVNDEPTEGTFDWKRIDTAKTFASATDTKIHFFHLIWGNQIALPKWLFSSYSDCGVRTRNQILDIMKTYIDATINRGGSAVSAWNVVTEAFADTEDGEIGGTGGLRQNCFYKAVGTDYIDQAFKLAKQANPQGILVLEDYFGRGAIGGRMSRQKVDSFFSYVASAKTRGVPIDAVGIENVLLAKDGSQFTQGYLDDLNYFFQKAQSTGVKALITQMIVYQAGYSQDELAGIYKNTMAACLKYTNCISLVVFGISDKYNAANSAIGVTDAAPLLFNQNFERKPAYYGIMSALSEDKTRACAGNPSDLNSDGKVNVDDYNIIFPNFGHPYTIFDYNKLVTNFGK